MTCPPGYIEVDGQCVPNGLTKERFDRVQSPSISSKINISRAMPEPNKESDPYSDLKKFGSLIRDAWDNRPDSNYVSLFRGSPAKVVVEGAEELIDLQFQIADKISSGDLAGAEQYSQIERERVESLGFKPLWTPGGFKA